MAIPSGKAHGSPARVVCDAPTGIAAGLHEVPVKAAIGFADLPVRGRIVIGSAWFPFSDPAKLLACHPLDPSPRERPGQPSTLEFSPASPCREQSVANKQR
jgi:hypothetical protein